MPATTSAIRSNWETSPPFDALSTRLPSSFGTSRPETPASTLPTTRPTNSPRRVARRSRTNVTTAEDGATGSPRFGERVLAK